MSNRQTVTLPFNNAVIRQHRDGHPVTSAADFLHKTIVSEMAASKLDGLELGSGNGIITIMLALQRPNWRLMGIELQKELHALSEQNRKELNLGCRFEPGDIRTFRQGQTTQEYDLVYANPPWLKQGSGKPSPDAGKTIGRQEIACTMRDVLACISRCLKPMGTAFVVYPLTRRNDLLNEIGHHNLEIVHFYQEMSAAGSFVAKIMCKPAMID